MSTWCIVLFWVSWCLALYFPCHGVISSSWSVLCQTQNNNNKKYLEKDQFFSTDEGKTKMASREIWGAHNIWENHRSQVPQFRISFSVSLEWLQVYRNGLPVSFQGNLWSQVKVFTKVSWLSGVNSSRGDVLDFGDGEEMCNTHYY